MNIKRRTKIPAQDLEKLPPILQRIYAGRGISKPEELHYTLADLLPYHTLKNIHQAAELLAETIRLQQRIMILGDFDADGATSTALAVAVLRKMGAAQVDYLVPNRFEYGYGLTPEIVAVAAQKQPALLITVDNGISSIEGVAAAKAHGMKVLITDHHLQGDVLPEADVIVNPNQHSDEFPSKMLAGVGVIFYVMLALRSYLETQDWYQRPKVNLAEFLDLVALGSICDVVPFDKNNRILIHQGLQRIRAGKCSEGLRALINVSERRIAAVTASDIGFAVGPRLNAAGRLEDMSIGIACLLSEDRDEASGLAKKLDQLNKERRDIEYDMKIQAFNILDKITKNISGKMPAGLCFFEESWHQGVIGIVASRIKDRFHRPVIVFAVGSGDELKGSARSIQDLHIRDTLADIATRHPHLIKKFGGHAQAAGLTINRADFREFSSIFAKEVDARLTPEQLQQCWLSDGELLPHEMTVPVADLLREAGPWGQAFSEPLFDGEFYVLQQRLLQERHLKLTVKTLSGEKILTAIAFNVDVNQWPNHRCERIQLAYRLDVNEYNGLRQLQMVVETLKAI